MIKSGNCGFVRGDIVKERKEETFESLFPNLKDKHILKSFEDRTPVKSILGDNIYTEHAIMESCVDMEFCNKEIEKLDTDKVNLLLQLDEKDKEIEKLKRK